MPVIVVGADTLPGRQIVSKLVQSGGEIRVFISDPDAADAFKQVGCKVALGDVSDGSHVEMAGFEAFTAVLVADAATDEREKAFASDANTVVGQWLTAVQDAGIHRTIWIGSKELPKPPANPATPEWAVVAGSTPGLGDEVARINELSEL